MRPSREPSESQGRCDVRASALLGLVHVPLMGGWLLVVVLDEWVDYAALLGMRRHDVSVYLSEVIPALLFFPSLYAWLASSVLAFRLACTRSVWYLWPIFLPCFYPVVLVMVVLGTRP